MKKIILTSLISLMLATNVSADTDGDNSLSKKPGATKDCFEGLNRATFSFNQGLDKVIFKPVAAMLAEFRLFCCVFCSSL